MTSRTRKLPFIMILFFLLLIMLGINSAEVPAVMQKAVRICLSCMGIG